MHPTQAKSGLNGAPSFTNEPSSTDTMWCTNLLAYCFFNDCAELFALRSQLTDKLLETA